MRFKKLHIVPAFLGLWIGLLTIAPAYSHSHTIDESRPQHQHPTRNSPSKSGTPHKHLILFNIEIVIPDADSTNSSPSALNTTTSEVCPDFGDSDVQLKAHSDLTVPTEITVAELVSTARHIFNVSQLNVFLTHSRSGILRC